MNNQKLRTGIVLLGVLLAVSPVRLPAQVPAFAGARWIAVNHQEPAGKRPCITVRKNFKLEKPVKSAVLTLTALGLYEAFINDQRVGDAWFTPGFTNYRKRLQYQRYNVTKQIGRQNEFRITLADGWYRGTFRNLYSDEQRDNFGKECALLLRLDITFTDGSKKQIVSDQSWEAAESTIRYAELYDGEMQDTRGRSLSWKPVKILAAPNAELVGTTAPPVRKKERFPMRQRFITPTGEQVIDFGQNLAGWIKLRVQGQPGDTLKLYHAEILDSLDNFYNGNLREAKAVDTYVLNGKMQVLEPHFTYHGFRYAKVEWIRNNCLLEKVKLEASAVALYSDLKPTGTFSCGDPLLNRLQRNIEWSMKSNFLEIPTDCPQRSERLGWGGDAQAFCATASFLADTRTFYAKWLADLASEQGDNGAVPNFIPTSSPFRKEPHGVTGWGDAAVIIPWTLYEKFGDTTTLKNQYPSMKAWVDYMTRVSRFGLFLNDGYGDWYAPGDSTSIPFIDQCFYVHSTRLLTRAATVLGIQEDREVYQRLALKVERAFLDTYGKFDTKATSTQAAYALALSFDLLPEDRRKEIAGRLARKIRENGDKLATGFLGTPHLLPALSRFGHTDLAYTLLLQRGCPSWLYPVTRGATTIWEKWDAIRPDGGILETSFNHYGYGAVGQWMYENILGIQAFPPGYSKIRIAPRPDRRLQWAKGSHRTQNGLIRSQWKYQGASISYYIVIPQHTTAVISLPGMPDRTVHTGTYRFKLPALKENK